MKRMICYFLLCALVLACIAGCITQPPVSTPMEPSGSVSLENPTNSQGTQQTEPDFEFPQKAPLPVAEREKTGPLIEYDPNRELYIMTGYNDCVYYLGLGGDITYGFHILSKKPLDIDAISVDISIKRPYTVIVKEITMEGTNGQTGNYSNTQFPYELYQCYQGKDFRKLSELKWELEYRGKISTSRHQWLEAGLITQEQADVIYEQYIEAVNAFESFRNAELEAYHSLKKEDLPQFYVYYVSIVFNSEDEPILDETFTEITVTISNQVYKQQVGQITLKSGNLEVFDQRDWFLDGYNADDGIFGFGNYPLPYNDGVHAVKMYFSMEKVDRYKSLTRLVLDNPNQELEAVWIWLQPEGGTASVYQWDMTEPFELYPGDVVSIHIIYRDKFMESNYLGYRTKVYGYLEYESDGNTWYKISECSMQSSVNLYVLYAIIFDGIDLESYYWDYYYLFEEPWRIDSDIGLYDSLPVIIEQAE